MPDETHPNYVKKYDVTPELLDHMYARTSQQLLHRKEAERRVMEWPGRVDHLLARLASTVAGLEARVAELEGNRG